MLSREDFLEYYPTRTDIYDLLTSKPATYGQLIKEYLPSKIWRLNNLYTITDKVGDVVPFKMNRAQFYAYSRSLIHARNICLKSRQQGISTLWLISFFDDVIFRSTMNCGLQAQDRESAEKLLERVKFLWERLDPDIKGFLSRKLVKNNSSEFAFNNTSTLYIRTSFRSTTLQRLHVSELGKIANANPERAKEIKTGSLQAIKPGNTVIIESTAEGANIFKEMWDLAVKLTEAGFDNLAGKDFLPVFLSWLDDPDCREQVEQAISIEHRDYFARLEKLTGRTLTMPQKNFWIVQERELEGLIHQEYPATPEEAFAAAKDGTYYARKYLELVVRRGRVLPKLYDRNLPVYACMDLGHNDYTVIVFFQVWEGTIRIIGEYYNSGEGLEHYAAYLKEVEKEREWEIVEIGLPHDASVVDLSAKGKNRQQILADEGIKNTVILDKTAVMDGIESVRQALPNMYIDEECVYIDKCMLNYTKEWNDVLEIWRDKPKRDLNAHGADTIRYVVQYYNKYLAGRKLSREKNSSQAGGVAL
jgi:hypothetical protein